MLLRHESAETTEVLEWRVGGPEQCDLGLCRSPKRSSKRAVGFRGVEIASPLRGVQGGRRVYRIEELGARGQRKRFELRQPGSGHRPERRCELPSSGALTWSKGDGSLEPIVGANRDPSFRNALPDKGAIGDRSSGP